MQLFRTSTFLRWVLLADAATCIAIGLLMIFGSDLLAQFLGLPKELSRYAGLSLLPFAAFLIYLARRENLSPPAVWSVIVLNALWTIDSLLLLLIGWVDPTGLGYAFIIFQACGVAMFAALEYLGLRKSAMTTV
ncbi:MAG: hypothetical protein H0W76_09930 [Pyrinomonadaceae bacterium]|nr:hypothetical protein [Pyrinomonadaceae bacterium]